MSTKEIKEALESAQKEVLEEINFQRSFFQRLFNKDQKTRLRTIQSWVSKAINQIKKLNQSNADDELNSKLQTHLNEKTSTLKSKEEELKTKNQKIRELEDKLAFCESEISRLQNSKAIPEPIREETPKFNEELDRLKSKHIDLEKLYRISQESLLRSQELSIEFYNRLRKLKTELLSK